MRKAPLFYFTLLVLFPIYVQAQFFKGFGVMGGLIGVHWSLALSAMVLLAVTLALFAFMLPAESREKIAEG